MSEVVELSPSDPRASRVDETGTVTAQCEHEAGHGSEDGAVHCLINLPRREAARATVATPTDTSTTHDQPCEQCGGTIYYTLTGGHGEGVTRVAWRHAENGYGHCPKESDQ